MRNSPNKNLTELRPGDINAFAEAQRIMSAFAERTGLTSTAVPPRRYLWTDAFAVCNSLKLFQLSGNVGHKHLALQIVDQVHRVLGRHRPDDLRAGWISGLSESEGERHPTRGGLRIGKRFPERRVGEPFDERLEWERDGQYFHYLTRWMHALNSVSAVTGDSTYNVWAIELAQAAHARFSWRPSPGQAPRMYWKMSVDLSRPLVPSMGHQDPLDAFVTYCRLAATAAREQRSSSELALSGQISEAAAMCAGKRWATEDPLGIGGLLSSAGELSDLCQEQPQHVELLKTVLEDAADSLRWCLRSRCCEGPAESRLAFRELGLSIGLQTVGRPRPLIDRQPTTTAIDSVVDRLHGLERYLPLADTIERFWLNPVHQQNGTWTSHEDINAVMLATSVLTHADLTPARETAMEKPR